MKRGLKEFDTPRDRGVQPVTILCKGMAAQGVRWMVKRQNLLGATKIGSCEEP